MFFKRVKVINKTDCLNKKKEKEKNKKRYLFEMNEVLCLDEIRAPYDQCVNGWLENNEKKIKERIETTTNKF